jgi:hypothetical protein
MVLTTQDSINRINKLTSLGCSMEDLGTSVQWFNLEVYIFYSNLLVLMVFLFWRRITTFMDIDTESMCNKLVTVIDAYHDDKGRPFYGLKSDTFEKDDIDDSVQIVIIDD